MISVKVNGSTATAIDTRSHGLEGELAVVMVRSSVFVTFSFDNFRWCCFTPLLTKSAKQVCRASHFRGLALHRSDDNFSLFSSCFEAAATAFTAARSGLREAVVDCDFIISARLAVAACSCFQVPGMVNWWRFSYPICQKPKFRIRRVRNKF